MRPFPRTAGRRLSAALLAAVLSVGAVTAPAAQADDPLKDRQKRVQKSIESARQDLGESSREMAAASARLGKAKTQLSQAQIALAAAEAKLQTARILDQKMQAELERAEADLQRAEDDLAAGKKAARKQGDSVASMISDIYAEGDPKLLAFVSLLESQTPADLARRTEMRDSVVQREDTEYQELIAAKVLLKVKEDQVREARDAVQVKREAAAAHLADTQAAEAEAVAARDSVKGLVGERRAAAIQARAARRADAAKLAKLKQEEAKIGAQLRARALAALRRARARGATGPANSGGFLSSPVRGWVTSPFGYRVHPIYGYWGLHNGIDFGAGCGAPMYAAADGSVVSAYWSDVYGNRLIIDNGVAGGKGIATIYNHAIRYTVSPGQRVSRGQLVGYMGDTGWSTGCHLHFIVMANGTPVDPANYL